MAGRRRKENGNMAEDFYGLWYDRPAASWTEALPIGNGRFGGMVYGGIEHEEISVNEETVWEGTYTDRRRPRAKESLSEMRRAIFEGRFREAERISGGMLGNPPNLDSYQPLCRVHLDLTHDGIFRDYRRELDLNRAVHRVRYRKQGVMGFRQGALLTRKCFVSAADRLMVLRLHSDYPGGLDMDIRLTRPSDIRLTAEGSQIRLEGQCHPLPEGVRFAAVLSAALHGEGTIQAVDGALRVRGARDLEIRLAGATDYAGGSPAEQCLEILRCARNQSYEQLLARHEADYGALFGRQRFSLGADPTAQPTDRLIRLYRAGDEEAGRGLYALWYNYLRYLMISSSRPGGQPSNLQGIWNNNMKAPWNSDYHPNVNMQINYWTSEGFNLPECVEPLADWLEKAAAAGESTARDFYGAEGWVLHHISDIFHCTAPMDGPWGIWPFGGAWLCRHLYEHYRYNGDRAFLQRRVLPLLRGAVRFMLDFLVECPPGLPGEGYLVTCPSHSPENRFITETGEVSWLTYACAMDMEIIRDLLTIYLDALAELGLQEPLAERAAAARARLVPIRISGRTGGIMEWIEDYEEQEIGHRHVSPLYALYPGEQITHRTPELLAASEKTLERRLSHRYDAQGWCCGWIGALFARLGRGGRALDMLDSIAETLTLDNLMVNAHGNPQVGDAQAVAAAIQEMLVQSHEGFLSLLPALPGRWHQGEIRGLRVRGGHVIDMRWERGVLTEARLTAGRDGPVTVVFPAASGEEARRVLSLRAGEVCRVV